MRNNIQRTSSLNIPVVIGFLLVTMLTAGGCEPLRKKFVRQKKKTDESSKFIPVLDPIDYPRKTETSEELYKHHFSLWQVWDKELVMRIEERASDKKIQHTLNQVLVQLGEMEKLLTGEKQQQLSQQIAQMSKVQSDLTQPVGIRNNGVIQKQVERVSKKLREGFRLKHVEGSLTK